MRTSAEELPEPPANAYEDDTSGRRIKPKRGRRPYLLQVRYKSNLRRNRYMAFGWLRLAEWWTHSRYRTEAQRDQAYKVLTRKAKSEGYPWGIMEYRKV